MGILFFLFVCGFCFLVFFYKSFLGIILAYIYVYMCIFVYMFFGYKSCIRVK